jgi:hypothetical protein
MPYLLKRHKNKKIPCVKSKTCIYCNTPFTRVSSLNKHLKDVCKKENEEYYKNITNITNNNNNITNNNNNQFNNNMAVNVLTKEYIMQNFLGNPCLMPLPDYNIIKNGNIIIDPYYEDDNIMFINTLVSQYERGKLIEYFGSILVAYYKQANQISGQSLWCSDLSRLKFLVRILPYPDSPTNMWVTDSSGIMVKKEVIRPLLEYVVKCIDSYGIKYPLKMITETDKFLLLGKIVTAIRNNSLTNDIAKYMAPHFTLGKQLMVENKK